MEVDFMSEYLSIKEFSEMAGVSAQSVYKRIKKADNPIQPFVKRENNQFTISKNALQAFYGIGVEQSTSQPGLKVDKPLIEVGERQEQEQVKVKLECETDKKETAEMKVINILQEQLKAQREELQEKNKLIIELNERLAESQRMLDQQQRLSLTDKQQILMLEEKTSSRKGLINRFFGIFNKNNEESK